MAGLTIHFHSRAPDDLYKNGIQREQFIPCIELIKSSFTVHCLDSDIGTPALSPPAVVHMATC
jgi:predicted ATPase